MESQIQTLDYATPTKRQFPTIDYGYYTTLTLNVLTVIPGILLLLSSTFNNNGGSRIGDYFLAFILFAIQVMISVFSIFIDTPRWRIPLRSLCFATANLWIINLLLKYGSP